MQPNGNCDDDITLQNVTIIGVPLLDTHRACLQCKARVEPLTPPLGRCSRADCKMMQRYDLCAQHTTAKLLLMYESEGQKKIIQLHAYGEQLHQIAGKEDYLTPEILLKVPQISSVTFVKDKKILRAVNLNE